MRKMLLVDFMYLWNRIYSIKGVKAQEHIAKLLGKLNNTHYWDEVYLVLDGTNSTAGRRRIYPDYKTNRSDKTELYSILGKFLGEECTKFNKCKFIMHPNFEADDVITYYVKKYKDTRDKYIYSGDTDLHQLLRFPNTHIGDKYSEDLQVKPVDIDEALARYEKKYNIPIKHASYITKCKMFKGDSGDNIPVACPGMRAKTISTLIEECWSTDEPLSSSILMSMATYLKNNGTEKDFNNFYSHRNDLIRNYKLTELGYTDIQLDTGIKTLRPTEWGAEWQ